jgi:endoglucanase
MNPQIQNTLPRWRGFNLLDMFTVRSTGNFSEDDFRWMADWGFNFVRIPACYTLWIKNDDAYQLDESGLEKMDRVVRLGQKYHIHVSINFHRAPGYSVNPERQEPYNLWKDQEALDAFCFHWRTFARRYKGIPNDQVSFDLVNEPENPSEKKMTRADHERVVRATVKAIREVDAQRLIIADGLSWGTDPLPELADLGIAQSCRAYAPMGISHYKASWVGGERWAEPAYPGIQQDGQYWDRERLEKFYQPWFELASQGIGVHCGEGGAFSFTPHKVVLDWFHDVLELLKAHNIGYALWNFRGDFGILDSNRSDMKYEDWHSHLLDRQFLDLLKTY